MEATTNSNPSCPDPKIIGDSYGTIGLPNVISVIEICTEGGHSSVIFEEDVDNRVALALV